AGDRIDVGGVERLRARHRGDPGAVTAVGQRRIAVAREADGDAVLAPGATAGVDIRRSGSLVGGGSVRSALVDLDEVVALGEGARRTVRVDRLDAIRPGSLGLRRVAAPEGVRGRAQAGSDRRPGRGRLV